MKYVEQKERENKRQRTGFKAPRAATILVPWLLAICLISLVCHSKEVFVAWERWDLFKFSVNGQTFFGF
jgi:hypothetical protein